MPLVRRIRPSARQRRAFRETGALVLPGLIPAAGVRTLRAMVERELGPGEGGPGLPESFRRARYDLGNRHPVTRELLASPALQAILAALIPDRLVFTQGLGFELVPGKPGLDWHFDFLSFSFVHPLDPAWTLWIPFDPVDPGGQRGGLEYVPESVYSARDKMVLSYLHVMQGPRVVAELGGREAYRSLMPCSPAERTVLDRQALEPAFAPGDALLTHRFVWHRSAPLREGARPRRLAFILRFVAASARYHGTFCRKLGTFSKAYGNPGFRTAFGLSFTDLADGDPLGSSRAAVRVG